MDAMTISKQQYDALLSPLNPSRVAVRQQGSKEFSYLEAWDIRRNLIRFFGIGGWTTQVVKTECVVDRKSDKANSNNWDVAYLVVLALEIPQLSVVYAEAAVGDAHVPDLAMAHDQALKSACSAALKRCAINLGDQFGLSLYQDGTVEEQCQPVVKMTFCPPPEDQGAAESVAAPVDPPVTAAEPQASENPPESTAEPSSEPAPDAPAAPEPPPEVEEWLTRLRPWATEPEASKRIMGVVKLKEEAADKGFADTQVTVKQGTMTCNALADQIVTGAFLPKEAATK